MTRIRISLALLALCLCALTLTAWSPSWNQAPQIPMKGLYQDGIGRCVALYEGPDLLGVTVNRTENMRKADLNRSGYAISTYNAITRLAQGLGRPDIASAAVDLEMVSNASEGATKSTFVCWCENTIWSGDPRNGGKITGCGGACGSCTHCVFKSPAIQ